MTSKNFFNKQNWKKQRKIERIAQIEHKYFIFCEGKETEPNYFEGFERHIGLNAKYKNMVYIRIEGLGKDTERVIKDAEHYVNENKIENAKIWCVYDKDSFPPEHFNKVSERARHLNKSKDKNIEYCVAWSNQCIEYWFILHFNYYDSDNDRKYYKNNLNMNFKRFELPKYTKNDEKIFEKLTSNGDPKLAIRYAKRRESECQGKSDTDSSPATKVYKLVEELAKYLPEAIKQRYL